MALNMVSTGEVYALETMVQTNDLWAILIDADWTPDDSDTTASFSECTAAGYSRAILDKTNWTVATETDITTATYNNELNFEFSEAVTIYGYAIVYDDGSDVLLWEEKLNDPLVFGASGGSAVFTPKIEAN